MIVVGGLALLFFERNNVSLLLNLHQRDEAISDLSNHIEYLEEREKILLSWQSVTKLFGELIDQSIISEKVDKDDRFKIFLAIVEIIAEYRYSLFKICDEYCNILVYCPY